MNNDCPSNCYPWKNSVRVRYEYIAASQNFTANGRYVESRRSRVWEKGPLIAHSSRLLSIGELPEPTRNGSLESMDDRLWVRKRAM